MSTQNDSSQDIPCPFLRSCVVDMVWRARLAHGCTTSLQDAKVSNSAPCLSYSSSAILKYLQNNASGVVRQLFSLLLWAE